MPKFRKGQSGNPKGRPRGSRNKKTLMMEAAVEGKADVILAKAIELAAKGDSMLIRVCLDRIWPARKERFVQFALPKLKTAADAMKASADVAAAVAARELTPGDTPPCGNRIFASAADVLLRSLDNNDIVIMSEVSPIQGHEAYRRACREVDNCSHVDRGRRQYGEAFRSDRIRLGTHGGGAAVSAGGRPASAAHLCL